MPLKTHSVQWNNCLCTSWPYSPWWRHQMETFSALLALCVGNSPVTGEFPSQRPVTRCFDVFFDLRLNKRFIKQSRRRWFETPSRSLWRHSKVNLLQIFFAYSEVLGMFNCLSIDNEEITVIPKITDTSAQIGQTKNIPKLSIPKIKMGTRVCISKTVNVSSPSYPWLY